MDHGRKSLQLALYEFLRMATLLEQPRLAMARWAFAVVLMGGVGCPWYWALWICARGMGGG